MIFVTLKFLLLFSFSNSEHAQMMDESINFYLFTKSPERTEIKIGDEQSLEKLNKDNPVRVVIHGWKGRSENLPIIAVRNAYLKKGNINVILVDWGKIARNEKYFEVTTKLKNLSQNIAQMINFLNEKGNIPYSNIYIAGHSLGAHLAGLTGRNLKPNQIDTIFGIDPARPLSDPNDFIKSDDAEYVEIIHTNIEPMGVGMIEKTGVADFYPDYGTLQKHCKTALVKLFCNHMAALLYFAESIHSDIGFYGIECEENNILKIRSCQCKNETCATFLMGGEPSTRKNGTFYLSTNENFPYAKGKNGF